MRFIYFQGKNHQWYWKLVSRNGRSIAISGEGFHRKQGCLRAIAAVRKSADVPAIEEVEKVFEGK